jgi:hypothetical protein
MIFRIVEIPEEELGTCILNAFKYMVEDRESKAMWFGSNTYQACVDYVNQHGTLIEEN